jgi:putative ubiquitin-RnfH superfamily antitoxin RatB of RatAB toxin-antitoxin module
MFKVRVVEAGGVFKEVELEDGATVETALRASGARTDVQKQIRVNLDEAALEDILENGDTVYIVPNIKGNL